MNYTEKYVLLERDESGFREVDEFEREQEALDALQDISRSYTSRRNPGEWRVVRRTEVIVASVARG